MTKRDWGILTIIIAFNLLIWSSCSQTPAPAVRDCIGGTGWCPPTNLGMGDVDTWAGLSTPHKAPKPSMEDRKREEAKTCLALNAYHEARGESFEGQVAVGQVALRRAGLDHHRVCAEIYRPGQFSWTSERTRHGPLPTGEAWQWALASAVAALAWAERGVGPDHSRGATYYHAEKVNGKPLVPYWTRGLELVAVIDNHRFYR